MYWAQFLIMLVLAVILFFLFRRALRRFKRRDIWSAVCAVIVSPAIYTLIILAVLFYINSASDRVFDRDWWLNNSNKRYEMAGDIINSGMLLGKTKQEVISLLGSDYVDSGNNDVSSIGYDLGFSSEAMNLPDKMLNIEFDGDKVINVSVW
ncbi:MAG: hypothetical protein IJ338_09925 [Bacteroidaceae bacterium]|nr:hypothetical protein [Bacteroidaceae bacterium]